MGISGVEGEKGVEGQKGMQASHTLLTHSPGMLQTTVNFSQGEQGVMGDAGNPGHDGIDGGVGIPGLMVCYTVHIQI